MKVKVFLEEDETIFQAEEEIIKAFKDKHNCAKERYSDPAVEEFANSICKQHKDLLDNLVKDIQRELHASSNRRY